MFHIQFRRTKSRTECGKGLLRHFVTISFCDRGSVGWVVLFRSFFSFDLWHLFRSFILFHFDLMQNKRHFAEKVERKGEFYLG